MCPFVFLPPLLFNGSMSDFSGFDFVISSNVGIVIHRVPGVVGFNIRIPMRYVPCPALHVAEKFDLVTLLEGDDRFFKMRGRSGEPALLRHLRFCFSLVIHRPDVEYFDAEPLLDRPRDFNLVRLRIDLEGVNALLLDVRQFFRDNGAINDSDHGLLSLRK
jgi:hypothetical protein